MRPPCARRSRTRCGPGSRSSCTPSAASWPICRRRRLPRGLVGRESAVWRAARRGGGSERASTRCSARSSGARYVGWQAAVLTGNPPLGRELRIKAKRTHTMYNGPIECRLLRFDIEPKHFEQKRVRGALPAFDTAAARARPGAAMFANRLAQECRVARRLGAQGRHRLLSRLRRRHARVRVLDRHLRRFGVAATRALRLRAGIRAAGDHRAEKARARRAGGVQRAARGARRAARARVPADAAQAEGRRAVREARRARRVRGRRRRRPRAARQLHGLLGHGLVPRPPADARAYPRARCRQDLPEPVRVHGTASVFAAAGGARDDDERRPIAHVSRLGAPQPRPQRLRRYRRAIACCKTTCSRGSSSRRASAST